MSFIVDKKNVNLLVQSIVDGNDTYIKEQLFETHPVDIGEALSRMEIDDAEYILKVLEPQVAADVLVELDPDLRDKLVSSYTSKEIAEMVIENIDSDDAADVLAELPPIKKEEVISLLGNAEQASDLVDLLNYEFDTAGGLMAKELIKVNEEWTIAKALREMRRQAENVDEVFTIYVVNNKGQLLGTLSLKKLLFSDALRSSISDLYKKTDVHFVYSSQSAEDVMDIMKKYDLVVLPVVDENHTLLGRITIDDALDVMKDEAEKDYQMASGISGQLGEADSVWTVTKARVPWLLIGLFGGICVSQVIGNYEEQLQVNPTLAFFIPLIAATGGNVGVQSSAIVVQGLANKSIDIGSIFPRMVKELKVAFINAIICSTLILAYNFIFNPSDHSLAYTVSLSLVAVILMAALFGSSIPLILNKFKIDPALATGPFITTTNDILGLVLYFVIARVMYGL